MEIIRRRFAINSTQHRRYSRRRAGNKILGKAGLLNTCGADPILTPSNVVANQLYLGQQLIILGPANADTSKPSSRIPSAHHVRQFVQHVSRDMAHRFRNLDWCKVLHNAPNVNNTSL
jgi:hypothetical protein